jgi:hypothetical protein
MCFINKVEARGIMCERKGQVINWAVFCDWKIKEQLRRIQLLEVGKGDKVGGHLGEETKFDKEAMVIELPSQAFRTKNVSHHGSSNMVDLEVLRKWQDALLASKKVCIWLHICMFYLLKTKDDCRIKLLFISHQHSNCNQLFQNAMATLQGHQHEVDAEGLALEELKKPLKFDKSQEINDAFMALQTLQRKWDS